MIKENPNRDSAAGTSTSAIQGEAMMAYTQTEGAEIHALFVEQAHPSLCTVAASCCYG